MRRLVRRRVATVVAMVIPFYCDCPSIVKTENEKHEDNRTGYDEEADDGPAHRLPGHARSRLPSFSPAVEVV